MMRNGQPIEVLGQLNLLSSSSIAMAHESSSKIFLEASVFIIVYPFLKCVLQSMRSHDES